MTAESIEVAPQELYLTEDDFEEDTNRRAEVTLWRTKISVVLHDKRTFSVLGVAYLPHRHRLDTTVFERLFFVIVLIAAIK